MSKTIKLKIILPTKTLAEIDAKLVTLPGTKGVFGVMPAHAKTTTNIRAGVVNIEADNGNMRFYIHGGVVQVNGEEINIVTEFAENLGSVSNIQVKEKLAELNTSLGQLTAGSLQAEILADKVAKYESLMKHIG